MLRGSNRNGTDIEICDTVRLAGLAEFERSLILARTGEGRTRAMARGVKFGRKSKLTAHQIVEARARRAAGEALAKIGRSYNVNHSTISRL
jgi:DNA invertase Pin-like site-specific DNA recombinase